MISFKDLKNAFLVALWFIFLTFPIMVIKVNPFERTVAWRWQNMIYVAAGSFVCYLASRFFLARKAAKQKKQKLPTIRLSNWAVRNPNSRKIR